MTKLLLPPHNVRTPLCPISLCNKDHYFGYGQKYNIIHTIHQASEAFHHGLNLLFQVLTGIVLPYPVPSLER